MTIKKTHWLRTTILIMIVCAIAGLALTTALFFKHPGPTTAKASLQFTFEGAADGIAPNGRAFDVTEIFSDEVLNAAIRDAGLGGGVSPEQIRACLTIRGVYPADMAEQVTSYASLMDFTTSRATTVGDYHPTAFNVSLTSDFDKSISETQLVDLLKNILDAFRNRFARFYGNSLETKSLLFTLDNYDYPQQLEILQNHYEMMSDYAQEMFRRQPSYRYGGAGFNDISVRLNNLIDSDIARLNADLTMNALTRDTTRLLTEYQFEIRDLTNQAEKQNAQLEKLDALIDSYSKNEIIYLSTTDALTKIDGNSSETYDTLVNQRKEVADGITEINSQISDYQLKLADLLRDDSIAPAKASADVETEAAEAVEPKTADAKVETTEAEPDPVEAQDTVESAATAEVVQMTDEEIAAAAEEAERQAKAQTLRLEKNIATLVEKGQGILDDFKAMLEAYDQSQINELSVAASSVRYNEPKILSGAFVKSAIKVAGPICALGFMLCMLLIFISRRRESKR